MRRAETGSYLGMKKILVAVDETEASTRAAAFVQEFFKGDDFSLTAVNVAHEPIEWLPAAPYGAVTAWPSPLVQDMAGLEDAIARQEAASQAIAGRQVPPGTDIEVAFGETVDAILAAADNVGADLIVVGSSDKGFLARLFSGSVSEQLVRKAPRPVLVVH